MVAILQPKGQWVALEQDQSTGKFEEVAACHSCPHCQRLFNVRPGSGRVRGFCFLCNRPTCGHQGCDRCTPWEARMEQIEGRLSLAAAIHRIRGL